MGLIKLGEAIQISQDDIHSSELVLNNPSLTNKMADDSPVLEQFRKVAAELKQIAPKAKDFLYFSAIMMHAAEAALLDENGNIKKDAKGNEVTARWEKKGESLKWVCSDPDIKPVKNSNGDIFPSSELIKAHKKWVGRPLCLDHKSSSVDMIRGVIVDTFYDHAAHRVVALCALDKINYPDLARKVATGVCASVSMGTAVGKAICTDCGAVARVESDFCNHMRNKSCYGEINVDLNPIELSIVVNGADPKAKIRHIVAAADSIARYVDAKDKQLNKLAEDETKDIELAKQIAEGLEKAKSDLSDLQDKVNQLKSNEEQEQQMEDTGAVADESKEPEQDLSVKEASPMLGRILSHIEDISTKLNKLANTSEDTEMTQKKAYFQGGGGVNEPTPGKPKYEKEDSDKIRNTEDKQMLSQDMGGSDGLFPGDVEKKKALQRLASERETKRLAALAAAKEALTKGAYFQGGGGVNEPTPGKPKYPKEDSDKIRDNDDKQMTGAPPFPGVGKVDGLYDKDLETKKKILRAKLTAKFIKAAKPNGELDLGESRWQVYADGNLILTATVNEITGQKANALYNSVATAQFGKEMISTIKSEGFDRAVSLYKQAQVPPPAPAAAMPAEPAMPAMPEMPAAMPAPAAPEAGKEEDKGASGDPKERLPKLVHDLQNLSADLADASDALLNQSGNDLVGFDELADKQVTASTKALIGMQKKLAHALQLSVKALRADVSEHLSELKLASSLVGETSSSKQRKDAINLVVADACQDAKVTLAKGYTLMGAFVKYARGTETLVKRAAKDAQLSKRAQMLPGIGDSSPQVEKSLQALPGRAAVEGAKRVNPASQKAETYKGGKWVADGTSMYWDGTGYKTFTAPKAPPAGAGKAGPAAPAAAPASSDKSEYGRGSGIMRSDERVDKLNKAPLHYDPSMHSPTGPVAAVDTSAHTKLHGKPGDFSASQHAGDPDAKADDGGDMNDLKVSPDGSMEGSPEEVGKAMKAKASFDLSTKEGRAAYRAKLAAKAGEFSDMIGKAHPKGGFTVELDNKVSGDLAKVETEEETHKAMMDVATAPPKVRKMAELIQKNVTAGHINPEKDFDALIAQGLDADAVKYWKSLYSQNKDGGPQYVAELVKDYNSKKTAEVLETQKVKVARAYALAHEMAEKNMIGKNASAINTQVDEILSWTDQSFDQLKAMVARQPVVKTASAMPQVGLLGAPEVIVSAPAEVSDLRSALEKLFTK